MTVQCRYPRGSGGWQTGHSSARGVVLQVASGLKVVGWPSRGEVLENLPGKLFPPEGVTQRCPVPPAWEIEAQGQNVPNPECWVGAERKGLVSHEAPSFISSPCGVMAGPKPWRKVCFSGGGQSGQTCVCCPSWPSPPRLCLALFTRCPHLLGPWCGGGSRAQLGGR